LDSASTPHSPTMHLPRRCRRHGEHLNAHRPNEGSLRLQRAPTRLCLRVMLVRGTRMQPERTRSLFPADIQHGIFWRVAPASKPRRETVLQPASRCSSVSQSDFACSVVGVNSMFEVHSSRTGTPVLERRPAFPPIEAAASFVKQTASRHSRRPTATYAAGRNAGSKPN
jgi:hypothetical protein